MALNQNKPLKQHVSLTLDEDVVAKIKNLSEESDRSFSQYINLVLRRHIAAMEKKQQQETERP